MKILAIIPARGGSKGIPRKNIRFIAGQPLIAYSINNAKSSSYITDVFVSTDDNEIEFVSKKFDVGVIKRPSHLSEDNITLDPVIYHAVKDIEKINNIRYDIIITMQPTSPLLTINTLDKAIKTFIENEYDTLISSVNTPHLAWTEKDNQYIPLYEARLNRQYLPKHFVETGAFVITKREFITNQGRFGKNISLYEVPATEAVDIDTPHDWWICEKELSKKKIFIRTDGFHKIGLGHIYRGLLLANNLIDHNVTFILTQKYSLGIEKIKNSHFKYICIENDKEFFHLLDEQKPDIVINDILNTTKEYVQAIKERSIKAVHFEDLGEGADIADCVINALYDKQREGSHYYWGHEYFCLRDEFMLAEIKEFSREVKNILIMFGGTDPSNFTEKVLLSIENIPIELGIKYTFILGMGYEKTDEFILKSNKMRHNIEVVQHVTLMTEYMKNADLAISSQGRTMYELARMGVPTIILSQNQRESAHMFGYMMNGFINLGLHENIQQDTLSETIRWLINAPQIRQEMHKMMKSIDLTKGIQRTKEIILQ